jgi:quercetin dioxygenase-like cupin family protein
MKLVPASLLAIAMLSLNATADDPKPAGQPVRNVIEHHDQSGVPGKEIVIGTATLPPASVIGYHTHPGDEAGYVIKGNLILKTQGQPDRPLKPGDSFFNPRGAVHSLVVAPGSDGGLAVSAWIVDKGEPMATPVPAAAPAK